MSTERITIQTLRRRKQEGPPLAMVTAYDFISARLAEEAGVEMLLVGDSLGNVVQGQDTTLAVTLDEMIYHARMVRRGADRALVVCDLPFLSYHVSAEQAIANAGRVVKETGVPMVKLEGGTRVARTIEAVVQAQIPVMGHVGLTPQSVHMWGGYRVQRSEAVLLADAEAVAAAGAAAIVIEGVPAEIAAKITQRVRVPTIGIGAGGGCDGQVLVWHDLLGLAAEGARTPKFVKRYADLGRTAREALGTYVQEVHQGAFPGKEHEYAR